MNLASSHTLGEVRALVAGIVGAEPEAISGWVLAAVTTDGTLGIASSASTIEEGYDKPATLYMLLDAAREIARDLAAPDLRL
jgi:hypothetical protein